MATRSTLCAIVATGLTLAVLPLGCGAAQEEYPHTPDAQQQTPAAVNEWAIPEAIVKQLRGCVKEHAGDLKTYAHEARFDVRLTDDGAITAVNLRSSTLRHEPIESCMMGALAGLSIPPSMLPMRSSEPFSGGESMRHSREPLGIAQAAGGMIALGPIIVIAMGVTLAVYIVGEATKDVVEAAKRNKRLERKCKEWRDECLSTRPGICGECFRYCLLQGVWNDRACPRSSSN